jgi:hypothetical protein
VRKSQVLKRAEGLRRDAQKALDTSVETMLGALQIASRSELERIDRKIASINKKLREIEKTA